MVWDFVKSTYGKAKDAADNAYVARQRERIKTALSRAKKYADHQGVQNAKGRISENWQQLELAELKTLASTGGPVAALETALTAAEEEAKKRREAEAEEARLEKMRRTLLAKLDDDGAYLTLKLQHIMPPELTRKLINEASEYYKQNHRQMAAQQGNRFSASETGIGDPVDVRNAVTYGRVVGDLSPQEKQIIRAAVELHRHDLIDIGLGYIEGVFAFNAGNTTLYEKEFLDKSGEPDARGFDGMRREMEQKIRREMTDWIEQPHDMIQKIVSYMSQVDQSNLSADTKNAIKRTVGDGAQWFDQSDVENSIYNLDPGCGLFVGKLESGDFVHYDGEGSLFTIAPPGSGKTQCQVMPNLIMYDGPAIVLDVKGECHQQTAGYRQEKFGPILRFAPDSPDTSAHYNPLDFVRKDPRFLPTDARKLADMLIVPKAQKDPYWEQRGRDILAALIGFVAHETEGAERTMKTVMDLLSPSADQLTAIIATMRETEIPFLVRSANQIESLGDTQKASIFDSARSQLSVWDLGELDPITDRSDWHPSDFKKAANAPTLYICVSPADIDRFASVLRVIIGQHLDYFMEVLPENMEKPIVFFLDEAPQLGSFEPLPKASSLGRQYGLRLWLFAQNRNQIETAYSQADTILGNAVVQCWMNVDERAASELEQNLGRTRGLLDGREKPLAEAHVLRGPDFRDSIVTVGRGEKPARLIKHFAFNDASLKEKMGWPMERHEPAQ